MKVVILCPLVAEGRAHARQAGLAERDFIAVSGGAHTNVRALDGFRVTEDDLVLELPGFRDGPHAAKVIEIVQRSIRKTNDAGPRWEKIGAA